MRVLMVVLGFEPAGGLEIYSRDLARGLVELGHSVRTLALLESTGSAPTPLGGVEILPLAPRSRLAYSAHFRTLTWRTASALQRYAPDADLVLCMHPNLAAGSCRGAARSGIPFWIWGHGTDIWGRWSDDMRLALSEASAVGTVSSYTASRIQVRLPEANVAVVFPTIDTDRYLFDESPPVPASDPSMLTVSRVATSDAYKGHDRVIESIPAIEQRIGRRVRYRVVGAGDGLDRLRNIARAVGVEDRLDILGRVGDEALAEEYRACDLFVMPSRMDPAPDGSTWGEGFGIVYIEAQACGRPVVASNQAAAPETIRDGVTGVTVDPYDTAAIAEGCASILGRADRGRSMGAEGRRFVEATFGWDRFLGRLEALFGRV